MVELSFNLLLESNAFYPIVVDVRVAPLLIAVVVRKAPLSIDPIGGENLNMENLINGNAVLKDLFNSLTLEPIITKSDKCFQPSAEFQTLVQQGGKNASKDQD
jgi:hypothetical protein